MVIIMLFRPHLAKYEIGLSSHKRVKHEQVYYGYHYHNLVTEEDKPKSKSQFKSSLIGSKSQSSVSKAVEKRLTSLWMMIFLAFKVVSKVKGSTMMGKGLLAKAKTSGGGNDDLFSVAFLTFVLSWGLFFDPSSPNWASVQ